MDFTPDGELELIQEALNRKLTILIEFDREDGTIESEYDSFGPIDDVAVPEILDTAAANLRAKLRGEEDD